MVVITGHVYIIKAAQYGNFEKQIFLQGLYGHGKPGKFMEFTFPLKAWESPGKMEMKITACVHLFNLYSLVLRAHPKFWRMPIDVMRRACLSVCQFATSSNTN